MVAQHTQQCADLLKGLLGEEQARGLGCGGEPLRGETTTD